MGEFHRFGVWEKWEEEVWKMGLKCSRVWWGSERDTFPKFQTTLFVCFFFKQPSGCWYGKWVRAKWEHKMESTQSAQKESNAILKI